jgi:serine/threonine-protein kinase
MLPGGRIRPRAGGWDNSMAGKAPPGGWVLPGYEHRQRLGSGAGGHVWLAVHQDSGTLVAVKYLVPGLHASTGFREAYRAEAELLAALDSPHVARLYEYVEGPPGAAIVMEAVQGTSLRELMKRERAASSAEAALCILKGSLLGLAAAHRAGVVHRDYKPANVLVTPEGESKLVDFGIAARTGEAALAAGTPLYMAPEQFHGAPASPAADVYAATATFFECITGERPFPGANAVELMAQHALGNIPVDLVPAPLRPLIRHGMAKDPFERPATAREFVAELEAVAGGAYGEDWEQRGRRSLATVLALLPLLLLAALPGAAQASSAAVATTILGEGGGVGAGVGGVGGGVSTWTPPEVPHGGGGSGGGGAGGGGGNGGIERESHEISNRRRRPKRHRGHHDSDHDRHDGHDHDHDHRGHGDRDGHSDHDGHGAHDGHDGHASRARRRRTSRWAVGGVGALVLAAAAVMAAAAYGSHERSVSSSTTGNGGGSSSVAANGSEIGALTGATTLVTPTDSPSASPVPSPTTSPSPSKSPSTAAAPTTATASITSAAPTTPTPSPTKSSASPSPSPTPSPRIISLSFGTVGCTDDVPTVKANVTVTSNGGAGTVAFNWFVVNPNGAQETVGTTTAPVVAGQTSQTVTSAESFAEQSLEETWGVSVASTPVAGTTPSADTFNPGNAACGVIIQ